jgi:signal transduction histidine kinase
VRRVKVWGPDGRILYSNDRREVGKVFPLTPSQQRALRTGGTVTGVSDLTKDESTRERELEPRLVETYTGVRATNGQRLLCEAYLSYEQIREQRQTVFKLLGLLAGLGVILFTSFQLGLGLVNLRWVRRRQAEFDEFARVVSDRARQRLARDLHDGTVQDLVGTALLLEGLLPSIRQTRLPEAERLLEGAVGSVRNSIQSLRSVMIEVYPRSFHERGLAAALDDLAQPMRTRGLDVHVTVLLRGHLSPSTSEAVFRSAQEALRNVMNHARARTARIRVDARGELVVLSITDDGIGMAKEDVASPAGHLGLEALRDIATERGDTLEIWSAPGVGTHVRMELRR